jgi:hypothetical protein
MSSLHTLATLAPDAFQVGHPLFGNQWLALLAVLGLIGVLLALVALLGRWLAATHPEPVPIRPTTATVVSLGIPSIAISATPMLDGDVPAELVPVIVAAIASAFGERARVTSIRPFVVGTVPVPSLEALMQQWSHEGRRQIYSSHKVR